MADRSLQASNLETILGAELLLRLLGRDPFGDDNKSKARLELILNIVDNLRGSFNNEGIRRWFYRDRTRLQGEPFIKFFPTGWETSDVGPSFILGASIAVRGS